MTDIKELKDEELEKVSGGGLNVGNSFTGDDAYDAYRIGYNVWFQEKGTDFAYTVCYASKGILSFIANKYWYKNGVAWNCGTCSLMDGNFHVITPPTTIHEEFTYEKPF